jgi:predicted transcriptional regulator
MIDEIIDTKIKMKIAKLFAERNDSFHVSDVAEMLKISKSRASECLRELEEKGLLQSRNVGRSKLYKLSSSTMAKMIARSLLQEKHLLKTIEKKMKNEVKRLKPVSFVLFGSALRGLRLGGDIDFLFVYKKKVDKNKLYEISSKVTEESGFDISILPMELEEFKSKARRGEEFILNVVSNYKLLLGKKLEEIIW